MSKTKEPPFRLKPANWGAGEDTTRDTEGFEGVADIIHYIGVAAGDGDGVRTRTGGDG